MNKKMILSVGMPRAGTGWYYNITQDLIEANGGMDARKIRVKYGLKYFLTEVNCNLGTLSFYRILPVLYPLLFENQYVIKLHSGRRPFANVLIDLNLIVPTFIYRDPRDALLSAFEYGQRMTKAGLTNAFTHLTTIEEAIYFMNDYVHFSEGWIASKKTLLTRYEDLILNYDHEVQRLCEHIDVDPRHPINQEIIDKYRPERKAKHNVGMHFSKGKIGRHREHLSPEQLELCAELFGKFLSEQGYQEK